MNLPNNAADPQAGWSLVEGVAGQGFIQTDQSLIFPTSADGTEIPLISVLTYKIKSSPEIKYHTTSVTYRVDNAPKWDFRFKGAHSTGGTAVAATGIQDGDVGNYPLRTGFGYANASTTGNFGNLPIENMKFRLFQNNGNDPSTPGKVNFNNFYIEFSRESTATPFATAEVYLSVVNAKTGADRLSTAVSLKPNQSGLLQNMQADVNALAALQANEYINEVFMIPMGTDGAEASRGALPIGTSISFNYNFKAWPGQKWPDDSPVGDHTIVPMRWDVAFKDANGDQKTLVATTNATVLYQAKGPFAVVQSAPISANANGAEPSSTVAYRLTGYNINFYGGQTVWNNPVIIVGMPAGVHMKNKTGLVAKKPDGSPMGAISVQTLSETQDRSYYKLTFDVDPAIPLSGADAKFTIDFDVLIPAGIAATYYKLDVVLTSNPATGFFMGSKSLHNNALPSGQTKADYGLGANDNYTWSNYLTYAQKPFKVQSKSKSNASSSVQSDKIAPTWTTNLVAPADFGDNVKMKLVVNNNGNIAMNKIKLYDIIPYDGYVTENGLRSSGSVVFTGITGAPAGSTIYYYHGANGSQPALNQIGAITAPSADWTTDPTDAKAFYVDFGNNAISGGSTLEVMMNFGVPTASAPQQTVYNQFSFQYTTVEGTSNVTGQSQGFSTHFYGVNYAAKTEDAGKVTNLPVNQSGGFEAAVSVDVTLASDIPVKQYYTFTNWKDSATSATYAPGDAVTFKLSPVFKELNLEAQFTPNPAYAITVNFLPNGGTGSILPSSIAAHAGDIISAPNTSGLSFPGKKTSGKFLTSSNAEFDFSLPLAGSPTTLNLNVGWETDPAANFALSFDVNGGNAGSKPAAQNAILGLPVGALPGGDDGTGAGAPTRAGYHFKGWATTAALANAGTVNFTSADTITLDTTVFAVWQRMTYVVTLDKNSGIGGTNSLSVIYGNLPGGTHQVLPTKALGTAPTRVGFEFVGWSTTVVQANTTISDVTQSMLDATNADITYYATWKNNVHVVTLNPNEGVAGTITQIEVTEGVGGKSLPNSGGNAPTRIGHSLVGWSLTQTVADIGNDNPVNVTRFTDANLNSVTAPVTIYAVWKPNIYTLTFNSDGGTSANPATKEIIYGKKVGTLPTGVNAPTKAGYIFLGWAENQGELLPDFIENDVHLLTTGKTVYAVWERKGIVVTLNPNNTPLGVPTSLNLIFGNTGSKTLPVQNGLGAPLYDGRNLIGWAKTKVDADAGTINFTNANLATITDDLEVFAVWKLKDYKVYFDRNGGETSAGDITELTIQHGNAGTAVLPIFGSGAPVRAGYDFKGWSLSSGANAAIFTNADLAGIRLDRTDLYAKWELKNYTLTLDGNGETTPGSSLQLPIKHGNPSGSNHQILPTNTLTGAPERTNYIFKGWATAAANGGVANFTNADIAAMTGNVTVYAVWERIVNLVTLDGNGATTLGAILTLSVD